MNGEPEHRTASKRYKTPKRKLVRFFEKSRDKWKDKTKDAKYQIKLLRKKIKYMEQNKESDKEIIKNLQLQNQQLKDKDARLQEEIDKIKKNL